MKRIIHCIFFGPTNSGKSTLINRLVGAYISIISRKCQATRDLIRGIFEINETQYICIDTPGLFDKDKNSIIDRKMVKESWSMIRTSSFDEGFLPVLIVDKFNYNSEDIVRLLDGFSKDEKKVSIVINKSDITKEEKRIEIINFFEEKYKQIILFTCFVSAKKNHGIKDFLNLSANYAIESEWIFQNGEITDKNDDFMLTEMTREYIYDNYHEEIPYKIYVINDRIDRNDENIVVWQTIFIPENKSSYKKIIEGRDKYKLKKAETILSQRCSKLLKTDVVVKLHVKAS